MNPGLLVVECAMAERHDLPFHASTVLDDLDHGDTRLLVLGALGVIDALLAWVEHKGIDVDEYLTDLGAAFTAADGEMTAKCAAVKAAYLERGGAQ